MKLQWVHGQRTVVIAGALERIAAAVDEILEILRAQERDTGGVATTPAAEYERAAAGRPPGAFDLFEPPGRSGASPSFDESALRRPGRK
jgi:hypothetical protein